MDSEKVKDIKKALEHCGEKVTCQGCPEYNNEPVIGWFECKKNLLQKTITLINDLGSENERLTEEKDLYKKQFNELEPRCFNLREANRELKDRIAKLGKENARLDKVVKHYQKLIEDGKLISIEQLKQFAEKVKEKIKAKVEYYKDPVFDAYNGVSENEIDEIVKELSVEIKEEDKYGQ